YGNRETNEGGEFKGGIMVPILQNRSIDARRAELWKSIYGRSAVEPFIQTQIIEFVRAGSYAYWDWVSAGLKLKVSGDLLDLAARRDKQIRDQVKFGARPDADIVDNERLILSRQVKLIESQRKLQSTAIKLSLYWRSLDGTPVIPDESQLPLIYPDPTPVNPNQVDGDVAEAISRRPELVELDFQYRMAQVDLQHAENMTLPELDASVWSAKDVGAPASSKGDKTPFQTEAGVNFSVPLQRRKALGKVAAVEAKLIQIATKRRFLENKIATEVQNTVVTIDAAYRSIEKARESVKLNEAMQSFETVKMEKGDSDLLRVNLRETATFDAQMVELEALLHFFESQADYRAALALDAAQLQFLDSDR
ncbi:MAG: TolC family protein, partial [Planctomycetes bacterium]|nr:TolC family protein [Planctomycetota bacterium]